MYSVKCISFILHLNTAVHLGDNEGIQYGTCSSSIACAQVIRVAHSGWRSSCCVDSGFLAFLLLRWYFPTGFSGCRGLLQIFCYSLFSHGVFLFPGSLAGYVAGFLFVVGILVVGVTSRGSQTKGRHIYLGWQQQIEQRLPPQTNMAPR